MNNTYEIRDRHGLIAARARLTQAVDRLMVLESIVVAHNYQGIGLGSLLLKIICIDADTERIRIILTIGGFGGLNYWQLKAWYEREGFYAERGVFVRDPK